MAGDGQAAIEAVGLTKRFGETRAVSGVDLRMPAGGVYGVLGPNGAGKTTTIRMLATLLLPDAGCARIFGHDVVREAHAVRERISLTGQFASVDEDLTGVENLVLLGRLLGYPRRRAAARAGELLDAFELTEAGTRPVKTYSGGMRRRLDIATSIVAAPQLLFLDEPTTGLDPHSRSDVWQLVRTLVAEGTTVLLTTQYLDEADQLADHITVIDDGTVVAAGTPNELKVATGTATLRLRVGDPGQRAQVSATLSQALDVPVELGSDPVELSAAGADPQQVINALAELSRAELSVASFALGQPSLDEVFRALTGHPPADQENAA